MSKTHAFVLTGILAMPLTAAPDERTTPWKQVVDFEAWIAGALPDRLTAALTGKGGPPTWLIEEDATAPSGSRVLAQTSEESESYRFPLCVLEGVTGRDVVVSVRFRPDRGSVDQAAGIAWRIRDAQNYYVVRANALEGNVVLYKVENGKRQDLKPVGAWFFAYGTKVRVPAGKWSKLGIKSERDRHAVFLDDEHLFDVEDATFPIAGKIGLWTKADSVTRFDDLTIEILDAKPGR
jgi:hypothetical protein